MPKQIVKLVGSAIINQHFIVKSSHAKTLEGKVRHGLFCFLNRSSFTISRNPDSIRYAAKLAVVRPSRSAIDSKSLNIVSDTVTLNFLLIIVIVQFHNLNLLWEL